MIADIVGHPWMAGETSTKEQIFEEFKKRQVVVSKRVQEEHVQEKVAKRNRRCSHIAVIKGKRYVWGDLTEDDKKDTEYEVVQLQMK